MHRFPVPAGTPEGDRSVRTSVAAGIEGLIAEHRAAVAGFGSDTRPDTLARAAERIRLTRHKVAAYSEYLAGERDRLERDLAAAAGELRRKVAELGADREPAPTAV
jgi:nitrogenase molybdenum-iron protein alpha/beta subunit